MYKNKSELLSILRDKGLSAKKELGQNFLINYSVVEKIIHEADLHKNELVYEIGPGLGVLTSALIETGANVHAIELDPDIIDLLEKNISAPNFELEKGNALKASLPSKPYKLVANIPYYITSPLLQHFLNTGEASLRPTVILVLVQKEVAEKICAKTGKHSVLSLQTQIFGKPSIVMKVPAGSFHPAPKVDSAVLRIDVFDQPLTKNLRKFYSLISRAFAQKRKKLSNTLQEIDFAALHIDPSARPQHLSIEEWVKITEN
ncbi:ribosomal RNA small subunit methyltransferase A [Candidatus Peregrinibacteria bacterium]|nr:ribosomal RNA small subunit methyltransferase A [Candidatus Peregrinibacteria bacterium]